MWRQYDPRVPWILVFHHQNGTATVRDTRTGEEALARSDHELARFAADHSSASGSYGLGDVIHGIAKRLGLGKSCTPCAERQARLNARVPRVFRR